MTAKSYHVLNDLSTHLSTGHQRKMLHVPVRCWTLVENGKEIAEALQRARTGKMIQGATESNNTIPKLPQEAKQQWKLPNKSGKMGKGNSAMIFVYLRTRQSEQWRRDSAPGVTFQGKNGRKRQKRTDCMEFKPPLSLKCYMAKPRVLNQLLVRVQVGLPWMGLEGEGKHTKGVALGEGRGTQRGIGWNSLRLFDHLMVNGSSIPLFLGEWGLGGGWDVRVRLSPTHNFRFPVLFPGPVLGRGL